MKKTLRLLVIVETDEEIQTVKRFIKKEVDEGKLLEVKYVTDPYDAGKQAQEYIGEAIKNMGKYNFGVIIKNAWEWKPDLLQEIVHPIEHVFKGKVPIRTWARWLEKNTIPVGLGLSGHVSTICPMSLIADSDFKMIQSYARDSRIEALMISENFPIAYENILEFWERR